MARALLRLDGAYDVVVVEYFQYHPGCVRDKGEWSDPDKKNGILASKSETGHAREGEQHAWN